MASAWRDAALDQREIEAEVRDSEAELDREAPRAEHGSLVARNVMCGDRDRRNDTWESDLHDHQRRQERRVAAATDDSQR
ncbi:hypothetical protein AB0368_29085 [Actinoplanes sp. NPDC051475]|uniref:hypothetical protein n=1 Tax=Actinoplanes sp. NPDC051475 TaxID=3157225 RepID=UPI00344B9FBB